MEITNYKLKDFLIQPRELIQEYITILGYAKKIETKKEVFQMKLKHVEMIKENLYSNNDADLIKVIAKVQSTEIKDVLEMPILEFFGILNSVKEQIETIARAEERGLQSNHVNVKWETVQGSKRLAKYGIYNTLKKLAGTKIWEYKKLMNCKYSEVFTLLMLLKDENDIQLDMDQIKSKPNSHV